MEDLDRMIMDTLKKLDCSFCNEVDSMSLMGLNDIIEATVKLLWACDPSNQERIPSSKLPHSMTTKYKTATTIANAIKELGIREEVGYQTLIYPNVYEIRQIFISLIEKLPKQAITTDDYKTPLDQLKHHVGAQINEDLKAPRYPCYCRYLTRASNNPKWHLKAHQPEVFKFSTAATSDYRSRICLALEDHADGDFCVEELSFSSQKTSTPIRAPRPVILKEPSRPPPLAPKPRTLTSNDEAKPTQEEESKSDESQLDALLKLNSALKLEIQTKTERLENIHAELHSIESEIDSTNSELESRDEKLIQILQDPENQIASLQKFIDQAPSRRQDLERKFEEWKIQNLPELERLRREHGQEMNSAEAQEAQRTLEELKREIAEKTHTLHKLQKQANREGVDEINSGERAKFLARIMYLVKSVNAQKDEILRSFHSCKTLEKERRQLAGNLDRTFTVVSQWLNGSAESDMILRKAHNLLVRMHSQCDMIIQSIEAIFTLNHAADELQDHIELLQQQRVDVALEQILNDVLRIRQENDAIRQRLGRQS